MIGSAAQNKVDSIIESSPKDILIPSVMKFRSILFIIISSTCGGSLRS